MQKSLDTWVQKIANNVKIDGTNNKEEMILM